MSRDDAAPPPRRRIVTGEDVQGLPDGARLELPEGAIVTDIAREWIAKKRIRVVPQGARPAASRPPRVRLALAADHAGFAMKEALKAALAEQGVTYADYGTDSERPVDYPDVAHRAAVAVALGHAELAVVIDGAGIGSAIAANKVPGVRAAPCTDERTAVNAREHNDANVLTLGARLLPVETALAVVRAFLTARITEERHRRRVRKIGDIEKRYYRPV